MCLNSEWHVLILKRKTLFFGTLDALEFLENDYGEFLDGGLILILGQSAFKICKNLTLNISYTFLNLRFFGPTAFLQLSRFFARKAYFNPWTLSENIWIIS